ncbi:hypothetical protein EDC04DRAFT_2640130 [Pisolithus marmoratus]|nr:hypothetical protein EDC04DRAFT_2640130 [Pisolithus marmoratus]
METTMIVKSSLATSGFKGKIPYYQSVITSLPHEWQIKRKTTCLLIAMYRYSPLLVPVTYDSSFHEVAPFTSLRIDPAYFGPSYAREAAYTDEFWCKRLNSSIKRTFVVAEATKLPSESESGTPDGVSSVTILAPSEFLPATLEPLYMANLGGKWESYWSPGGNIGPP